MEKLFVLRPEALELKKLGFNEECFALFIRTGPLLMKPMPNQEECEQYFGGFLAPIYAQAFAFFREKHGLHGAPCPYSFEILDKQNKYVEWGCISEEYPMDSYEIAELACLRKLIEIVKQRNDGKTILP